MKTKSEETKKKIFAVIDNSAMEIEQQIVLNNLIFDLSLERWMEGQQSGIETCKNVYQKTNRNKATSKKVDS